MKEREILFDSEGLRLAGVLRMPDQGGRFPAVLLVHGSLEQDRDGNLLAKRDGKLAYKKSFFLEIARRLCAAGFAVFSWDRRGCGRSEGETGDVFAQSRDAIAALHSLECQEEIDSQRIAVLGQSAGVYTACLLARDECGPKAYILQGGLFRDYGEMMAFNYERVARYAGSCPENLAWVEKNDLHSLIIGLNLDKIERDARKGKTMHELVYKGRTWRFYHDPSCYDPENAPSRQFKHIRKPVLIIHGKCDLNVPAQDAISVRDELMRNGNHDLELVIIPDVDHSFQEVPAEEDLRLRERMSLDSFHRPFSRIYFYVLEDFLKKAL
jgi:dipeptidyl aminopeptidase/acylaminoacyl peptidase